MLNFSIILIIVILSQQYLNKKVELLFNKQNWITIDNIRNKDREIWG